MVKVFTSVRIYLFLPLLLAACAPHRQLALEPLQQSTPDTQAVVTPTMEVRPAPPSGPPRQELPFDLSKPEAYLEREIYRKFGLEVLETVRSAPSSILLLQLQGMPHPQDPTGGRSFKAAALTPKGWAVWRGPEPRLLPPEVGRRLDQILATRALWLEPGSAPPNITCMDGGGAEMVIRHNGKVKTSRLAFCDARWKLNEQLALTLSGEQVIPSQ